MNASDLPSILTAWTPGSVGIWSIFGVILLAWWKGLPPVLDAWTNSVDKERSHREREIDRLERQIAAGDERHEECLAGQKILRAEITELNGIISAMVIQMRQIQLSAVGLKGADMPPALLELLDKLPAKGMKA